MPATRSHLLSVARPAEVAPIPAAYGGFDKCVTRDITSASIDTRWVHFAGRFDDDTLAATLPRLLIDARLTADVDSLMFRIIIYMVRSCTLSLTEYSALTASPPTPPTPPPSLWHRLSICF
jgi:hypothetical protein